MSENYPEKWTGDLIKKMHLNKVKSVELARELGVTEAYISMLLNSKTKAKDAKEKLEAAYEAIIARRT